ncbi:protein-tyrosine-phosphatase [Rivularia sp. PCC 7116]|uniref:arsenate-mycothiol transferase ArsC n=1 Tax=Rivularia sp. PCC 7116 TaxID=373994 RepID=UPI00029F213E|nr:low molecular weight phosphatase family protein [Rivularia sp. PCC 7116]AFY56489.1 protein-tyrosine-phosphatase [Rivularia sp. PCC 7116]
MKKVLFLCTGNYYRSRFAEKLFNDLASQKNLSWEADSRGLALERGVNNIGAISRYAVVALKQRGITITPEERFPKSAITEDFQQFDLVIAVDESEHRSLMQERFPQWLNNIEYWLIHDIDKTSPEEALGELEKKVRDLISQLGVNSEQ